MSRFNRKLTYLIVTGLILTGLVISMLPSVFGATYNATVSGTDQQTVKGFGGSLPWYNCGTPIQNYPLAAQAVLDMGTSVLRVFIHNLPDVFDSSGNIVNTALADTQVAMINWAASHGIPYNYNPGWNNLPPACYSGGFMLQQYEQAQCNSIRNMIQYFTSHGCPLPLMTNLANEPSAPMTIGNGVFIDTIPIDQFVRVSKMLRTTLNNAGLNSVQIGFADNGECMYQCHYLGGAGFPLLSSDSVYNASIGCFATHTYWASNGWHQTYIDGLATWQNGRDSWETEYCTGSVAYPPISYAQRFCSDVSWMKVNYWEAWQLWNFNGPADTDVVFSGNGASSLDRTASYYFFKRVWTNVPPGSRVRTVSTNSSIIEGTNNNNIAMETVAFINSSKMVVVFVNPDTAGHTMNISGLTGTSASIYQISATAPHNTDMSLVGTPAISGGSLSGVSLPSRTLTVIVTNGGSGGGATPTPTSTPTSTTTPTMTPGVPTPTPTSTGSVTVSPTPTATVTPTGGPNLLVNPGFETGSFSPWSTFGSSCSIQTTNVHSGTYSVLIGAQSSGCCQCAVPVSPNTTYTLKVWGKAGAGGNTCRLYAKNFGGSEVTLDFADTTYVEKSINFTTGSSNTTCEVGAWLTTTGTFYVDDFSLTSGSGGPTPTATVSPTPTSTGSVTVSPTPTATPTSSGTNLLTNPGFETGSFAPWDTFGSCSVQTTNVHSGTYSAKFNAQSSGCYKAAIPVSPSTTYTLKVWGKAGASGNTCRLYVKNYGGTQIDVNFSDTTYTEKSLIFTTGSTNTTCEVGAWLTTTGTFYVDDFTLN